MLAPERKYLIVSPINEFGGVNLDVAFLADIVGSRHPVKVISLGDFFPTSSVFLFNRDLDYNSLDRMLYQDDSLVQWITWAVGWLKPLDVPDHFRVENALTRSTVINIKKRKLKRLQKEILEADDIVLCSQLTSNFMQEIVEFAYEHRKRIFFRTTGMIHKGHLKDENIPWFNKVNRFIHHSQKNKQLLHNFTGFNNHSVVDQNAYFEDRLLEIPAPMARIRKFFTLSRLHASKQIDTVIKAFLKEAEEEDLLTIFGSGPDEERLKDLAYKEPKVKFGGLVDFEDMPSVFAANDCLIISSQYEAGPYTGVEAMAAARPLISTRVGAMRERLPDYSYFYDGTEKELASQIRKLKSLYSGDVRNIALNLRALYLENYSQDMIKRKYEEILF